MGYEIAICCYCLMFLFAMGILSYMVVVSSQIENDKSKNDK